MRGVWMLETFTNQAAGLQGIALQTAPRVMAMASHGNQQGELPLLWRLCATLTDLGYPVVVLDANALESPDNPGLSQRLADESCRGDDFDEPGAWSVLPSALGLQQLASQAHRHGQTLEPLADVLTSYGVIVIYARAEVLTQLLPGSSIEPLLTVSPVKMSSVTAYQALKQMLLEAGLRPTVANIAVGSNFGRSMATQLPVHHLQECALAFLGYRLDALTIRAQQPDDDVTEDIHRLALRLLENAMPLSRQPAARSH